MMKLVKSMVKLGSNMMKLDKVYKCSRVKVIVLSRNNGIMWFCGSVVQGSKCTSEHVVLWFRGQSSKHDEIRVNGAMVQ